VNDNNSLFFFLNILYCVCLFLSLCLFAVLLSPCASSHFFFDGPGDFFAVVRLQDAEDARTHTHTHTQSKKREQYGKHDLIGREASVLGDVYYILFTFI
jgi:hypothetical protein